jgi:magnesium-transporting ATPase (P-type)
VNGPPPGLDPDRDRQSARNDQRVGAVYQVLRLVLAAPILFVVSFWRTLLWTAIVVASSIAVLLVIFVSPPAFSWNTLIVEVTLVVLGVLVTVLVAHAVLLTRPFPKPESTPLSKANHRLSEIAAGVHSAIDAGRRG